MTCPVDPALAITAAATAGLLKVFSDEDCPPLVGTSTTVRFFAGDDNAALAAWDSHVSEGCTTPFLWVRAMRRFRTSSFPAVATGNAPCGLPRVLAVELGVAWCAYVPDDRADPARYATEATVSMDTAWRLESALCTASSILDDDEDGRQIGTEALVPYGPDGGVISWSTVLLATY